MGFEDGSAVRLTIARYYTPTGRSIQKSYKKGKLAYYEDFEKRFENGELYKKDSIKINDSLKFKTPKGRIVYGGGGIVPDIFVPREGTINDEPINRIIDSGIIEQFVFQELDKNKYQYASFEKLEQNIKENDTFFNNFQKYLTKNNLKINLETAKDIIKQNLLMEIVKQSFNKNKYYQTILKDDAMIKVVLKI
jgi:carboxyl-terminal processing protease